MSSSGLEVRRAAAKHVAVSDDVLVVDLVDGRTISVPIVWYPRLTHGTPEERGDWELIDSGEGIHWPQLDEDISVTALLAGLPSGESGRSLEQWLLGRQRAG